MSLSLLFWLIPVLLYTYTRDDISLIIVLWICISLLLKIFFDYKSSGMNFIINLLLISLYLEILYFYNESPVVYWFAFTILWLFLNNLFYNKEWFRSIIKLLSFSFYYFTSGFLKVFDWATSKINNFFIFFPIAYIFVIVEIYGTQWIYLFSNFFTNWLLSEISNYNTLNTFLYLYLVLFFILNFKRIFWFFDRAQLFSLIFFFTSIIFIFRWNPSILIKEPVSFEWYLFYHYFVFVIFYFIYSIYLPLLKPKVIHELDFWSNMRAYAVQLLEKNKKIKFIKFLENCDNGYINENYKYHSELNDSPINWINVEDLLNRKNFITYLNNVISSIAVDIRNKKTYHSYSIGLVWNWWEWKTSVINMLCKKYLDINSLWINTLHFNPWNYRKDDIVLSFFSEIESALWYWYDKDFQAYVKILWYLWSNWSWISKILLSFTSLFYWDRWINNIKKKLNEKLSKRNEVLLVIIDDLDRCTPEEVLLMLNILKNLWDLSNIIYFVSYDKLAIENILTKNWYLSNYLDKVINQELYMPISSQQEKISYISDEITNIVTFISKNYCFRKPKIREILKLAWQVNFNYEIHLMFAENNLRITKKILNLFKFNLIDFLNHIHKKKIIWEKYSYQRTQSQLFVFDMTPKEISNKVLINILKESKASVLDFELHNIIKAKDWVMLSNKYWSNIDDIKAKSNFDDYLIENYLKTKISNSNGALVISYDKIGTIMSE